MNTKNKEFLIFGCDEYAIQIAQNLHKSDQKVLFFTLNPEEITPLQEQGFEVLLFDLGDDWSQLKIKDQKNYIVYCALCDEAENVFLTISLRMAFTDITIVALASDLEHATKLKMAGADKTIVTEQITANLLYERISNPTASELLQKILYENSDIKIAQITVDKRSELLGQSIHKTQNIQDQYGVIILAIIDNTMQTLFSFTRKGLDYTIQEGDILIVVAMRESIEAFKEATGEHYSVDWHHWKWFDD